MYLLIVSNFVVYTWLADRLPVAVYLSVVGLPGSGKTTLLELLRLLCRRAMMASDISNAAMSQICTAISPTLLIDENDWTMDRASLARRQQLRAGTTHHAITRRIGSGGHSFGPKVLTALEPPDDPALNRRCVLIPMQEANDVTLLKPNDPRCVRKADEFQQRMLHLRFDLYTSVKPAATPGAERLRSSSRDLLTSLAGPYAQFPDAQRALLAFFLGYHESQAWEPLSPRQDAVLAVLFQFIHTHQNADYAAIGPMTALVNDVLRQAGERTQLKPRKAGAVLTSLGFGERDRANTGLLIPITLDVRRRIHTLVKTYGNAYLGNWGLKTLEKDCELCTGEVHGSAKVK